jgi:hypothetical protein
MYFADKTLETIRNNPALNRFVVSYVEKRSVNAVLIFEVRFASGPITVCNKKTAVRLFRG